MKYSKTNVKGSLLVTELHLYEMYFQFIDY